MTKFIALIQKDFQEFYSSMYHLRSTVARHKPTFQHCCKFICFNLFLHFDGGKRSAISQTNPVFTVGSWKLEIYVHVIWAFYF